MSQPFLPLWRIDTDEPVYALTFDDGPHPEITPRLLDILDRKGVQATFFLPGERALEYPGLVAQIAERGHGIGSHGFRHSWNWWRTPGALARDLDRSERILAGVLRAPKLCRPPYGMASPQWLSAARRHGYRTVLWSLGSGDWKYTSPGRIVRRVRRRLRPGAIVLFHECRAETGSGYWHTLEAVDLLLENTPGLRSTSLHALLELSD
ncbi:MAG: Peptidoglycan-N-acetylglucosamine deacetylase [Candidatus Latescibacteria bacterium ADurb.Bin168]|nr:MAG: Peptidoglycan-N-acetylglucosamine deacetylase [Candidatus Latescibacteria bacterium ADurb.Bin168]